MTLKHTHFEKWQEFETSEIFIATDISNLRQEIENNCIYLFYPETFSDLPGVEEFAEFLSRVRKNRQQQLIKSGKNVELIYYSWFDEQAGHFIFNIINSEHEKLPFGCLLDIVADERQIIEKFLSSFGETGIPWSDLKETGENDNQPPGIEEYILPVYKSKITIENPGLAV